MVVVAGCSGPAIGAEPWLDAGQDASPASGGNAQGGAPAGGAAGSGGTEEEAGPVESGADADGESAVADSGPDIGADAGPDVAPEVGLPCDWPAVFAACQSAHPLGAKAADCACVDAYQGDPNCYHPTACGNDFCSSPTKGSAGCAACLSWLNTTWPQKCAPNCAAGTDCAAFFQCVKLKNC